MRDIEKIRKQINVCDWAIAELLVQRMDYIREIIDYKRANGVPILQPKQEARQQEILDQLFAGKAYEKEQQEIFRTIVQMSKRVQARELLHYNIALIGFMGVGKSTVCNCLKDMLAMDLVETDELVVQSQGMSINEIFAKYGEEYFRNCESNAVIGLMDRSLTVISCGGGLVMRDENVKNLKKSSRVVLLTASPETVYQRVKDSRDRPILNGHMSVEYIRELMEKRRARYEAAADLIINTDGKGVYEICEELIRKVH